MSVRGTEVISIITGFLTRIVQGMRTSQIQLSPVYTLLPPATGSTTGPSSKVLIVPREITKSDREHKLPLSDFLVDLLKKRHLRRKASEWVFQSSRLRHKHLSEGAGIVHRVRAKSGIKFTFHDLRRTFLTMGEKLDVPIFVLKRLVNHSVSTNTTGGYVILDIERIRPSMSRITDAFIDLLGINDNDIKEWKPVKESNLTEVTQLLIPLDEICTV